MSSGLVKTACVVAALCIRTSGLNSASEYICKHIDSILSGCEFRVPWWGSEEWEARVLARGGIWFGIKQRRAEQSSARVGLNLP